MRQQSADRVKWKVITVVVLILAIAVCGSFYLSLYLYYEGNIPGVVPKFTQTMYIVSQTEPQIQSSVSTSVVSAVEDTQAEPSTDVETEEVPEEPVV